MDISAFVNETERQAALQCAENMRTARAALRLACADAAAAGFGSMMLTELQELVDAVNDFRATYDLV